MVIKYKKANTFADVKPGEVFSYTNECGRDMVYMKTENVYYNHCSDNGSYNCVLLCDGTFDEFVNNAPVVVLKGSFVVGD